MVSTSIPSFTSIPSLDTFLSPWETIEARRNSLVFTSISSFPSFSTNGGAERKWRYHEALDASVRRYTVLRRLHDNVSFRSAWDLQQDCKQTTKQWEPLVKQYFATRGQPIAETLQHLSKTVFLDAFSQIGVDIIKTHTVPRYSAERFWHNCKP